MQRGVDIGQRPLHDFAELIPVVDRFKWQLLDRRTGDDQPVESLRAHLVKSFVEFEQVLTGGVAGLVAADLKQLDVALNRGVAQQPEQLGLGFDLLGHQVEDRQPQRPDILGVRPFLVHDKDIFFLQHPCGGEGIRNIDWHRNETSFQKCRAGLPPAAGYC